MARKPGPKSQRAKGPKGQRDHSGAGGPGTIRLPVVVVVTKGGDGGRAVAPEMLRGSTFGCANANARQVLTGGDIGRGLGKHARRAVREGFDAALVETADPFDCAHNDRDPLSHGTMYLAQGVRGEPRAGLADRPRRRYHGSQLVGTGETRVGLDSAFDGLYERSLRLAAMGVSPGRVGAIRTGLLAELLDSRLPARVRLRDVLHQRTSQDMTPGEAAAERAGSEMLRKARAAKLESSKAANEGSEAARHLGTES